MATGNSVLTWFHIGDLHLTRAGEQNHADFKTLASLASALPAGSVDFVFLAGDNADDGKPEQYEVVREILAPLTLPLHVLPGDHDMATGSLDSFYRVLGARKLPYSTNVKGHRCLFLDVVSEGTGGPDFRVGKSQLAWCARELEQAAASGETAVIFMHTYPADLREGASEISALLASPHVVCVDMGHTHYNELANDGRTVFMATRSTGQIEEGLPGFSIAAVDSGRVSWRFKEIANAWPFVLATSPVDRRLATSESQNSPQSFAVRAKVLSDVPIVAVEARLDGMNWRPMERIAVDECLWSANFETSAQSIRVRASDERGRTDEDVVEPLLPGARQADRFADGSDKDRISAWPEKGILGTQLGPNRNGRKW
jgi:Icc protein